MKTKTTKTTPHPTPVASQQQTASIAVKPETADAAAVAAVYRLTVSALKRCQEVINEQMCKLGLYSERTPKGGVVPEFYLTSMRAELADALLLEQILINYNCDLGEGDATNLVGAIWQATGMEFPSPDASGQSDKVAA